MAKKRIFIATDCFLPRWDGVARFLSEVIPRLAPHYDIEVVAPAFPGEWEGYKGVRVRRLPVSRFTLGDISPAVPDLAAIDRAVKEADIVWTQTLGPIGITAILSAWLHKKHTIATIHTIEWELFSLSPAINKGLRAFVYALTKRLARVLYNRCSLLIVPSKEIAELLGWERIRTRKRVVHLGVDTEKFRPVDKARAKQALGIDPKTVVVGFFGRIGREKNLITLHRAFFRLQKKHSSSLLMVIGTGVEDVRNLFKGKPRILLAGPTDNVVPFVQAMDIYVLPSLTETTSLTTLEAMSCGVAVVSTPVGYVKDYLKSGYNGFFFPKQDSYTLYRRLELLAGNPLMREQLGARARKTALEFSWEKTVANLREVLDAFLAETQKEHEAEAAVKKVDVKG